MDYDLMTLGKPFKEFEPLLFYDSLENKDASHSQPIYSQDPFLNLLQKKIIEFLDNLQQSFEELSTLSTDSVFSRKGLILIQCEKLYCNESSRVLIEDDNFLLNRLIASYIRLKTMILEYHKNCYNPLKPSILLKSTQTLLFQLIESLLVSITMQFPEKRNKDFVSLIREMKHYIKGMLIKSNEYLEQETVNLYGKVSEENLIKDILNDNKKQSLSKNKPILEKNGNNYKDTVDYMKNSTQGNELAVDNNNRNLMKKGSDILDPIMNKSIIQGLTAFFKREGNFHELIELKPEHKNEEGGISPKKKDLLSVFDHKVLESYPSLNETMNENMIKALNELAEIEKIISTAQKKFENLVNSCHASRDLTEEFKEIHLDSSDIGSMEDIEKPVESPIDNSETDDGFSKVEDLEANIQALKKLEKPRFAGTKLMVSHSFQPDASKEILKKGSKELLYIEKSHQTSLLAPPPKFSLFSNKNKGMNSPTSPNDKMSLSSSSLKKSEKKRKKLERKEGKANTQKLNVEAKDLIKIDSNTQIAEELRHVEFEESDGGFILRDAELFDDNDEQSKKINKDTIQVETFLRFMEKLKSEEGAKTGVYFRGKARVNGKGGGFIKRIQIHQEVQGILKKKGGEMIKERKGCYWENKGWVNWEVEDELGF